MGVALLFGQALTGCDSTNANIGLGVAAATILGAQAPTSEIEQIYYLGSFDPQDQLPPTVYRVRLRGQASVISNTHFASGWVPAALIDSLGGGIEFDKETGRLKITAGEQSAVLNAGRRLVQFGPEGIREAPAGHRLVVVMGSSPEKFFQAIDSVLGDVSQANQDRRNNDLSRKLYDALAKTKSERDSLDHLQANVDADLKQASDGR